MVSIEQSFSNDVDAISLASHTTSESESEVVLSIPDIRCAACIQKIENALMSTPGICRARVNLTTRQVRVRWKTVSGTPPLINIITQSGFSAQLTDTDNQTFDNTELAVHVRALAVAGFAAGNVMMLSLSVWSGADDSTRYLFHLLSAAIAVPALIFCSRLFFSSAWRALRHGTTNMDVPICVGIVLTTLLSLYDTLAGGHQVYFDAAIMLVFFLLIGRTLDTRMRFKARDAMGSLRQLQPAIAYVIQPQVKNAVATPIADVRKNDLLQVKTGEHIAVDCCIVSGTSTIDMSIVSGESVPQTARAGMMVYAGCRNLDGDLTVRAVADVQGSYLARIEREIMQAEHQKGHYQQLADRVVSYYSPFVHAVALLGFVLWITATRDWYQSVTVGVAVLIITCPCALGLAVPIARVIAAQQLMLRGVLMKNGQALERLALVSTVVFDKTGTLTTAQAGLDISHSDYDEHALYIAQMLSAESEHPYARAILSITVTDNPVAISDWHSLRHVAGAGIEGQHNGHVFRLGSEAWALSSAVISGNFAADDYCTWTGRPTVATPGNNSSSILSRDGQYVATFSFKDTLRPSAASCVRQLESLYLSAAILSGDKEGPVLDIARALSVERYQSSAKPWDKVTWIQANHEFGELVLMVGDGINDSPALSAASVSMVPATAANMTRRMGDFIILADRLTAIPEAIQIARQARRIMIQNLWLAVGYNLIAMPLALAGIVTPLMAALAMSLSSAIVVANSLRLARHKFSSDTQSSQAAGSDVFASSAVTPEASSTAS